MKFFCSLALTLFFSLGAFAQEVEVPLQLDGDVTATTQEAMEAVPTLFSGGKMNQGDTDSWVSRFGFFIDPLPMVALSGGFGVGLEVLALRWLSVFAVDERERRSTEGVFEVSLDESAKVVSKNQLLGLRLYNPWSTNWLRGFYINSGYKWSRIDTTYLPGLFNGAGAGRLDRDEGVYAGLGYRLASLQRQPFRIMIDVAINYEPGFVSDMQYDSNGTQLFGSNPDGAGILKLKLRNSFTPDLRIGIRF